MLVSKTVELYGLSFMRDVEKKIAELKQTGGDQKDIVFLELALAAYIMECDQRVEMTISIHPGDKAAIEREAEMCKMAPSDLMIMATLREMHPKASGLPQTSA